jgi:hypothetical protein
MNERKTMRPSAALVVATISLFVALSGTAGAVVSAAVPLAKRALVADNAKKLGGQTAAQIATQAATKAAAQPGPASTAAGLVVLKTGTWSLGPDGENDFTVTCDAGQKAVGGGWEDPGGWTHSWDDRPTSDGSGWRIYLTTGAGAPGSQSGGLYAVCLR